jgi:ATP-dependent DNA helicase RecG
MANIEIDESENIEFKSSLAEKENAGATIAGFANNNGGILYFGIKNSGEVVGLQNISDKTITQLAQLYFDNLEPEVRFSITKDQIHNKEIISINVEKSLVPHHTYKGKPYIRVGPTTKIMSQQELTRRLIRYNLPNKDYSSQIIPDVKIENLSP